jgi:hypothetical protein
MASPDERVFLVAMSRLAINHTGTRAHLQRINVVQDVLCQCVLGYDTIDHGLWECGLLCALTNELQEKLRATEIDHGRSIREILEMRNMVALRLQMEKNKDTNGIYPTQFASSTLKHKKVIETPNPPIEI